MPVRTITRAAIAYLLPVFPPTRALRGISPLLCVSARGLRCHTCLVDAASYLLLLVQRHIDQVRAGGPGRLPQVAGGMLPFGATIGQLPEQRPGGYASHHALGARSSASSASSSSASSVSSAASSSSASSTISPVSSGSPSSGTSGATRASGASSASASGSAASVSGAVAAAAAAGTAAVASERRARRRGLAATGSPRTSSMTAIAALSPLRGPILVMRVYPPSRSENSGAISVKS